ncbi:unnamed protein product, partial [Prorocentrum cordatum]
MADIDASILLEWVNSLDWVVDDGASGVEELGDGRLLLRVMHDASPDIFPSLEGCATPLHDLLSGLLDHFRARHGGRGEACARRLLEGSEARGGQARAGPAASAALLLQLVVVATLETQLAGGAAAVREGVRDFGRGLPGRDRERREAFHPG